MRDTDFEHVMDAPRDGLVEFVDGIRDTIAQALPVDDEAERRIDMLIASRRLPIGLPLVRYRR